MVETRKRPISRRMLLLGATTAGLGAAVSLFLWGRNKEHGRPRLSDLARVITIEGPFRSGEFPTDQLKTVGLDENYPVLFKVCFEQDRGYCFVALTFALKKKGLPPHDVALTCSVVGENGKVLGRDDSQAFVAHPAPAPPVVDGTRSLDWPGREILFELEDTAIRDINRLEVRVS